eukprot:TRINITY_DN9462_c0_g1_i4.p1 TRINITY_DN9462_c0_g1~~TRINITY_DN9462_c0_g1_i4.p1  ORF type:complete len:1689 (+),score=387.83 TRINITY_DN9462_c0_g1_i4:80-5146(+)
MPSPNRLMSFAERDSVRRMRPPVEPPAVSMRSVPSKLSVRCSEKQEPEGVYELVPGAAWHGAPVWDQPGAIGQRIYSDGDGRWIAGTAAVMETNAGWLLSAEHGGRMPHEVATWEVYSPDGWIPAPGVDVRAAGPLVPWRALGPPASRPPPCAVPGCSDAGGWPCSTCGGDFCLADRFSHGCPASPDRAVLAAQHGGTATERRRSFAAALPQPDAALAADADLVGLTSEGELRRECAALQRELHQLRREAAAQGAAARQLQERLGAAAAEAAVLRGQNEELRRQVDEQGTDALQRWDAERRSLSEAAAEARAQLLDAEAAAAEQRARLAERGEAARRDQLAREALIEELEHLRASGGRVAREHRAVQAGVAEEPATEADDLVALELAQRLHRIESVRESNAELQRQLSEALRAASPPVSVQTDDPDAVFELAAPREQRAWSPRRPPALPITVMADRSTQTAQPPLFASSVAWLPAALPRGRAVGVQHAASTRPAAVDAHGTLAEELDAALAEGHALRAEVARRREEHWELRLALLLGDEVQGRLDIRGVAVHGLLAVAEAEKCALLEHLHRPLKHTGTDALPPPATAAWLGGPAGAGDSPWMRHQSSGPDAAGDADRLQLQLDEAGAALADARKAAVATAEEHARVAERLEEAERREAAALAAEGRAEAAAEAAALRCAKLEADTEAARAEVTALQLTLQQSCETAGRQLEAKQQELDREREESAVVAHTIVVLEIEPDRFRRQALAAAATQAVGRQAEVVAARPASAAECRQHGGNVIAKLSFLPSEEGDAASDAGAVLVRRWRDCSDATVRETFASREGCGALRAAWADPAHELITLTAQLAAARRECEESDALLQQSTRLLAQVGELQQRLRQTEGAAADSQAAAAAATAERDEARAQADSLRRELAEREEEARKREERAAGDAVERCETQMQAREAALDQERELLAQEVAALELKGEDMGRREQDLQLAAAELERSLAERERLASELRAQEEWVGERSRELSSREEAVARREQALGETRTSHASRPQGLAASAATAAANSGGCWVAISVPYDWADPEAGALLAESAAAAAGLQADQVQVAAPASWAAGRITLQFAAPMTLSTAAAAASRSSSALMSSQQRAWMSPARSGSPSRTAAQPSLPPQPAHRELQERLADAERRRLEVEAELATAEVRARAAEQSAARLQEEVLQAAGAPVAAAALAPPPQLLGLSPERLPQVRAQPPPGTDAAAQTDLSRCDVSGVEDTVCLLAALDSADWRAARAALPNGPTAVGCAATRRAAGQILERISERWRQAAESAAGWSDACADQKDITRAVVAAAADAVRGLAGAPLAPAPQLPLDEAPELEPLAAPLRAVYEARCGDAAAARRIAKEARSHCADALLRSLAAAAGAPDSAHLQCPATPRSALQQECPDAPPGAWIALEAIERGLALQSAEGSSGRRRARVSPHVAATMAGSLRGRVLQAQYWLRLSTMRARGNAALLFRACVHSDTARIGRALLAAAGQQWYERLRGSIPRPHPSPCLAADEPTRVHSSAVPTPRSLPWAEALPPAPDRRIQASHRSPLPAPPPSAVPTAQQAATPLAAALATAAPPTATPPLTEEVRRILDRTLRVVAAPPPQLAAAADGGAPQLSRRQSRAAPATPTLRRVWEGIALPGSGDSSGDETSMPPGRSKASRKASSALSL